MQTHSVQIFSQIWDSRLFETILASNTTSGYSDRCGNSSLHILHIQRSRNSPIDNCSDTIIVNFNSKILVCDAFVVHRNGYDRTTIQKQRSNVQELVQIDLSIGRLYATVHWIRFCSCTISRIRRIFINIVTVFRVSAIPIHDSVMCKTFLRIAAVVDDGIYNNNLYDDTGWIVCVCN